MKGNRWVPAVAAALAIVAAVLVAAVLAPSSPGKTTAKTLKIGLVTDIGGLNDRGFNQLAYQGLQRAQKKLGVKGRVLQSTAAGDYIPNLSSLAQGKYDLVIGVGFLMADQMDAVATRFPKTKFAIVDVDQRGLKHKPKNVEGLLFKEQEAGYLVGYLAGLAEKRRAGKDVIGSVGGIKLPAVDRYIAGYRAGAAKADPGIEALNGYSQTFTDQAKCKEEALTQIANGAGVIFQVAGGCGLGALDAAKEKNVWGIGVDAEQSSQGPEVLTSAIKRVDQAVYLTIQSVQQNKFKPNHNMIFDLKQGGVALGKVSSKVPKSDVTAVNAIKAQILSGKIKNIPTTVK